MVEVLLKPYCRYILVIIIVTLPPVKYVEPGENC